MDRTIITVPNYYSGSSCGYCHGEKSDPYSVESLKKDGSFTPSSTTIGFQAMGMTCVQYDSLMNMGFRRSGSFLYKPDLLRNCCRLYTIRSKWGWLKITKEHRKTVNRFIKFILDEEDSIGYKSGKASVPFDIEDLIRAESNSSKFRTSFGPASYTDEKFALYKKYQMNVHNDKASKVTRESFERFLCEGALKTSIDPKTWDLVNQWRDGDLSPHFSEIHKLGQSHECYYYEDKLVCLSVLDFLPSGLSAVYFVWDPDYAKLGLGTLSGIREILMAEKLGFNYYYLGYYIDDCVKMKYKKKFGGEILDVCNGMYFPIEKIDEYMKDGRLFLVGDSEDMGNEKELMNFGCPRDFEYDGEMANIVERVYGHEGRAFVKAKNIADKLLQYDIICEQNDLSLTKHDDDDDEEEEEEEENGADIKFRLPSVIPGVIPLWQLKEMIENGEILNKEFQMFDPYQGRIIKRRFRDFAEAAKGKLLEGIRLMGVRFMGEVVVYVN